MYRRKGAVGRSASDSEEGVGGEEEEGEERARIEGGTRLWRLDFPLFLFEFLA